MTDPYAGIGVADPYEGLGVPVAIPPRKPKVNTAVDVGKSALSGLAQVVSSGADIASNMFPGAGFGMKAGAALSNITNRALHLPQLFDNSSPQELVNSARAPTPASPTATPASDATSGNLYQPKTTAGRYARTAAQFAPAAFIPGSAASRAANVFVPAAASETAGEVAHHFGASPQVENAARMVGAVGGGVAAAARVNPGAITAKPNVPKLEKLVADKNAAYDAVKANGERYSPEAFSGMLTGMAAKMDENGFSSGSHPKAFAKLRDIGSSQSATGGYSPTLEDLDKLRFQIGRDVASSPDKGERMMGTIMRNQIDQFIADQGGSPDLLRARDLNTRVEKLQLLNKLDAKAARRAAVTGSGGNINNTLRQNIDKFIDKTPNLTDAEHEAAMKVVMGTPSANLFRQGGKLSPEGNGLGLTTQIVGGVVTHGASLPIGASGFIAKRIADGITKRNVQALRDLIASGGSKAEIAAAKRAVIKSQPPLLRLQNPLQADQSGNMFSAREAVAR